MNSRGCGRAKGISPPPTRWLPLALLWAVGCSGTGLRGADQVDAAEDAPPDHEAACGAFAATLCERRWECLPLAFTRGYGFGDSFGTQATCVERVTLACRGWTRLSGTRATPAAIEICAADIGARECRTSTQTLTRPAPGCQFERGSLVTGAACEAHLQCASGNCLSSGADTANWKCSAPGIEPPAGPDPLGASCVTGSDCGVDLVCFTGVCQAPALLGEPCGAGAPACAEYAELKCGESGTCVPHQTSQGACGKRAIDNAGYAACEIGECVGHNDFGLGHCQSYADDGAACDPYAGPVCLYPARCMDHLCRVPGL